MELRLGPEGVSYFLDRLVHGAAVSDLWTRLGLALALFGLGTKLGLAPMYAWQPETYDEAPPSVVVLLSGVQNTCVILTLFRILQIYRAIDPGLVSYELMAMGLATMVISALNIVATGSYKRLLAYAASNHAGVIVIGLAIGPDAAYGVVVYAVCNAFVKAILFLTAGNIKARYGTKNIKDLVGLLKEMPYSGLFLLGGTFALLGFAPFGSFLGELVILSAMVKGSHFGMFVATCAILTVCFVATGRALFPMIFGAPSRQVNWAGESLVALSPNLLFLGLLIVMGIYLPSPLNNLFQQVAATLGGR
jgi:hydrogenase-4 component F